MEENSNENEFIIQTIDLTKADPDSEDPLSQECVYNETPIFISTTKLNNTPQYITCYENGEIVLKQIDDAAVKATKKTNENVPNARKFSKSPAKLNTNSGGVKITQEPYKIRVKRTVDVRKKLCYQKPYNIQQATMQTKQEIQAVLKYPRRQIIDHKIMISPREFKNQLNYTADTITSTKLAPCTRQQLLHVLNGITTLFAHPAHKMPNANLMQLYVSRCTCKKEPNMMSTEDMDLLPLIENLAKPSVNKTNAPARRIYSKRKNNAGISTGKHKIQIIEPCKISTDTNATESNINMSSIKKIYRNRKSSKESHVDNEKQQIIQSNYISENIDHKYSKKITNDDVECDETNIDELKGDEDDTIYTITLDLDNIKEEHITDNQIVILSVDNDGELTENNIGVLLDAANNIKTETETEASKKSENEVVALTRNVGTEDFDNRISNIFVVRKSDDNDSEQILGDILDLTTP